VSLVVSKEGAVQSVNVISGHPLLVAAALDAVKQCPPLLNGNPVEVSTEAEAPFHLDPSVMVPK